VHALPAPGASYSLDRMEPDVSRILAWAFAMGIVLLVIAFFALIVAPTSPVSTVLVVVALVLLAALAVAATVMARRAKGWYRVTPRDRRG
jgi:cell division protein FtsW (lipid II flippase)